MHYRITKVQHGPDKRDDIIAYLKTKDEDVISIEGLQSVRMIALSETESIAISKYENEQQIKIITSSFSKTKGPGPSGVVGSQSGRLVISTYVSISLYFPTGVPIMKN